MNEIHHRKIKQFLENIDIDDLAKQTGFEKRKARKITAYDFLLSFFLIFCRKTYSFRMWAVELSSLSGNLVSFQAIAKKFKQRHLTFVKSLFAIAIQFYIDKNTHISDNKLLSPFSAVLIEDSSCVKLSPHLRKSFPGARNQAKKKSATCRIQFCLEVKSNSFENITLTSFVKNDSTFANDVIKRMKPKSLIIRDLGYFNIDTLRKITEAGCFYISRYKTGISVYDPQTEQRIDLVKYLKKLDRSNIKHLDIRLKIGSKQKQEVRLVAMKLTDKQIKQRRKQAKRRRRDNVAGISKEAKYLMSWNIFITNIDEQTIEAKDIYELYSLRWHIEIIFKNWKSNFKMVEILNSFKGDDPVKVEMLLYLCLCFMVLIYVPKLNHYHKIIFNRYKEHLSPYKFADFMISNLKKIFWDNQKLTIEMLLKYCCYDKRTDRTNLYEKIYTTAT